MTIPAFGAFNPNHTIKDPKLIFPEPNVSRICGNPVADELKYDMT